jgi:hypothetical protein
MQWIETHFDLKEAGGKRKEEEEPTFSKTERDGHPRDGTPGLDSIVVSIGARSRSKKQGLATHP